MTGSTTLLLRIIADRGNESRFSVASAYATFLYSDHIEDVDWGAVNRAIIDRWSESSLRWIKSRAWTLHSEGLLMEPLDV